MLIRCFDFETSGLPTETDKHAIVEIGVCDLDVFESGKTFVGSPEATFCNPGRKIDHEAMATHHITDGMVEGATGDVSFIGEADYYAAHFAEFEAGFWKPEKPLICTWKVALRLWPDFPAHNLQFLRYRLDLPAHELFSMPPHRAGPDAYMCALLLERIVQEKRCSIEDMVRWSSGPGLLPRCPLHAHKGKKWEDVPASYLDWIVNKAIDMDRTVKANANRELKRREAA